MLLYSIPDYQLNNLDKPSPPTMKGRRGTTIPNTDNDNRIKMATFGIFHAINNATGGKIKRARKKDL